MGGPHDVVVVGSLNVDYRVEVPHRPDAGETVVGGNVQRLPGGKGANQAVAVAHAGGSVAMVGDVGDDPDADLILQALDGHGVDVRHVRRLPGTRTGNAYILVTPDGENSIVVAPGANHRVDTARAVQVVDELAPAVVLLQGELRADATAAVLAGAHGRPRHVVLNLAPVMSLPDASHRHWDTLVVNAGEAAQLLDAGPLDQAALPDAARALRRREEQAVVITLGPLGAIGADSAGTVRVPAPRVDVVDTTGAGDAFVGAFALRRARGDDLRAAVEHAVAAGARAVGYAGAQPRPAPRR